MKIDNINNTIRESIFKSFTQDYEYKSNEFKEMMLNLKKTNYSEYYKLVCFLYPIFYVMNEERVFNREELNEIMEEDLIESGYDEDDLGDQIEELDDIGSIYIYDLSEINNPEDLIAFLDKNEDALCEILVCTCMFHKFNYFYKRGALERMVGFDKYFMRFNPSYYMDKIEYTHDIDKNEFIEIVDENIKESKDDIPIRFKRIGEAGDFLADLEYASTSNYFSLINEITEDAYKYQKFLILNKLANKDSELLLSNIDAIENYDMMETPYLLEINLDYFFSFHSKPKEFKEEVYKYFDQNKEHYKIKIKTNEQM